MHDASILHIIFQSCYHIIYKTVVFMIQLSKVGGLPALVARAEKAEADFTDFLTRVNLK